LIEDKTFHTASPIYLWWTLFCWLKFCYWNYTLLCSE